MLHFSQPYSVTYNGTKAYYVLNQQGDVVRIVTAGGASRGVYYYDAWGNILYNTDNDFLNYNPLRYRGYVYDTETSIVKPGVAGIHVFYIVGRKRKMPVDFNALKC